MDHQVPQGYINTGLIWSVTEDYGRHQEIIREIKQEQKLFNIIHQGIDRLNQVTPVLDVVQAQGEILTKESLWNGMLVVQVTLLRKSSMGQTQAIRSW